MSGTTPRLGLKTWDQSDPFLRQDFNDNSARLDSSPGVFLCTSSSRPAWGAAQAGMRAYETDTRREVVWTGSAWREPLSAPPVWVGGARPDVAMGHDTHVYYKLATFQVNRPGALLVDLAIEVAVQSTFTMNAAFRVQVDGNDSMIGPSASYIRVEQVHNSGGGWQRSYMVPAMGLRAVGVGSHSFGIHMYTIPGATTVAGSMRLVTARGSAILVNSTDT
ncbi:hypothetical protein ACFQ6C_26085 [Streptomyces sp. NPDC056454]|uniref:hypothetical protein n=1 Tax=Streptomyces sp. NPDC056454 TaxID=3345823 RepID=UPI00367640DA